MNDIRQTTQETLTFALVALFAAMTGSILYVGWLYFAYIKIAMLGLGGLTVASAVGAVGYGLIVACLALKERYQAIKLAKDKAEADIAYRRAEATKLLQTVTEIKPGHNLVLTHADYPMQMQIHAAPQLSLADKVATVNQLPAPSVEADLMGSIVRGDNWIKNFLFDANGKLRVCHVKTDGPTGVGKTYLMLQVIHYLQYPYPSAEYWLCDPKFEGEKSGWPFTPFVTDFDLVAEGAEYLYQNVVLKRKHDNVAGIEPKHPAFLLFDEFDGCFDEHGKNFVKPVRRCVKEGRSGLVHVFASGQSPLAKDIGLGGALLRNMTRFVMGNEAAAFVSNGQFSFHEKDYRRFLASQLSYLQERNERGVLVIPQSNQGKPFVAVVPEMTMPDFNQAAPVAQASKLILDAPKGDVIDLSPLLNKKQDDEVIKAMIKAYLEGVDITNVARLKYSSDGTKQCCLSLIILRGNDVKLLPKHEEMLAKYLAKKTT